MEGGLVARIGVCIGSVLLAGWMLLPTLLGKPVQEQLERAAERAAMEEPPPLDTPAPWWVDWLPNKKVNLGLDLQGGIDLTLEVDTEEAIRSTIQRDVLPVKSLAESDGVALADVRRHRESPSMLIQPAAGTGLDAVKNLMRKRFGTYVYTRSETIDGKDYFIFAMTDEAQASIAKSSVDQALETIRNRIDETGVKEPSITRKGEHAISIQLPGETDVEQAVAAVGTTARLEFLLVDEDFDAATVPASVEAAKAALPEDEFNDDRRLSEWLVDNGHLPAGRRLVWSYRKDGKQSFRTVPYVLKEEVLLSGDDVNTARTEFNPQTSESYVSLAFKPRGQAIFAQVTGDNVGKRFAIVLDDQVRSAPTIRERINGTASISMGQGNLDEQSKEAGMLSLVLRSGSLPAPVAVGEVRTVGATLGDRAIKEGVYAAVIGSVLVFLFTGIYYRVSGFLADVSLLLNGFLVLALLALAGATLTLPGICGIALTIGMAVDANIIIFERIREELRAGKNARSAIDLGFQHATVAVLDSNISALLAGVVLYSYGTGPIRGFAVTLLIGIVTTLFTAIFVARTLMELVNGPRSTTVSI